MIYFPSPFLSFRRCFQDLCIWQDFRELDSGGEERYTPFIGDPESGSMSIYFALCLNLFLLWTFLSNGTFYSFFTLAELNILFLRTLIIKLFSPDIGGNLQNASGKYANCFSSHRVCWKSIVFISVCKTIYLMMQSKIDLSLLVHRCINFMGVHPKVETYWNNSSKEQGWS